MRIENLVSLALARAPTVNMEEEDAAADPYLPYDGGGYAIPLQEISGRGTPYALLLLNSPHLCKRGRSQKHMADIYVEPTLLLLLLFFLSMVSSQACVYQELLTTQHFQSAYWSAAFSCIFSRLSMISQQ